MKNILKFVDAYINKHFDECGDIHPPEIKNKELQEIIKAVLSHDRFCHDGWEDYEGYRSDAAQIIVGIIEERIKNESNS